MKQISRGVRHALDCIDAPRVEICGLNAARPRRHRPGYKRGDIDSPPAGCTGRAQGRYGSSEHITRPRASYLHHSISLR